MSALPVVVTAAGFQPTPPATLRQRLVDGVAATNPGYTADLPGGLVEDVASTDVGALALVDAALVELGNSLTPFGANEFLLNQLGVLYGVPLADETNTSVLVVFTGPAGYPVARGFTVSDGTYQYVVQAGGIIGAGGTSSPLYAVAILSGSWAVPSGTVQQLVTQPPPGIVLAVNNPTAGTPGGVAPSAADYRAAVLGAGLAISQGMPTLLKAELSRVAGVQQRLISVQQQGASWVVVVGGGDPYEVANAIFDSLFAIPSLSGSTLSVVGITSANPGVVTTDKDHNYATGQAVNIAGVVGMAGINNVPLVATVLTGRTFSIGINTTASGAYASGGVVTPSLRNVSVAIPDYPDTYVIPFVNPPQQTVTMTATWNTNQLNFVSDAAVAQLTAPALAAYVNSIAVGQPMNLFELQATFQAAVAPILPVDKVTRMVFAVSINGVGVAPSAGTGIIAGDPESFFQTTAAQITVLRG